MLGIRYNSVHTNNCESGTNESLSTNRRNLIRQFSVVDSFFHQRKAGDTARQPKSVFILMAVGLLLIATGITSHLLQPYVLIFKWKLIFEKGGEIFELWKTPPVDLYVKIYLFNVTNAREYLRGDADKMTFEEVGPYVYRELLSHENVTFLNNGTLYTKPSHPLVFQEHLSNGHKEEDVFFVPNIALLSIAQVASRQSYLLRLPLNLLIRQTKISALEQQTAKQFMFGFETTLTTLGNTFLPNWITFNKVGLIDRMYDFDDDFETIYTGETDESLSGLYDSYLGSPNLPQWDGDHCSSIRKASDGTKFKSFIKDDDQLLFFRKSMCRPQRMDYLVMYYTTPHSVTGRTPTELIYGHTIRSKIPSLDDIETAPPSTDFADKDLESKEKGKDREDIKRKTKRSSIDCGDSVLMQNLLPGNKLQTTYNSKKYVVMSRSGPRVIDPVESTPSSASDVVVDPSSRADEELSVSSVEDEFQGFEAEPLPRVSAQVFLPERQLRTRKKPARFADYRM
ncbi:scavenger receptor class B member 1 isoform X4 [Toxorhynchites rutilus septentrionalis]|uniref:scavenger receptor class B member 1 isoform X4 n=1 Tax=Toxorhynchites rutilus septentrionalis TaxID=329112 RepID=UPI00247A3406|nr:scavenger receptor class B member 1 isoform X4 [Toxorhynchites rutilus septentrionalis]